MLTKMLPPLMVNFGITTGPRRVRATSVRGRRISIESIERLCALARAVYDRRASPSTDPNSPSR